LILCYGVSVNLVEGIWKAQISAVYIEKQDYARFMANLQTFTGIVSMIAMLLGSYLFSFASWKVSAFLTPIIIFVTGTIFYLFAIYQTEITSAIPGFNFPPIIIAVFLGLLQNVLGKATKYAFFDSTKEMAYIPLDEALKSKGKAAADVIGGRLGKSGGALTQQLLLTMAFSFNVSLSELRPGEALLSLSPILFLIFSIIMIIWCYSVNLLSKEFNEKKKIAKASSDSIKKAEETNKASSDSIKKEEETNKQFNSK
jgi:AAA family ATP:ADP antiporter